jgi:hypothetical protein
LSTWIWTASETRSYLEIVDALRQHGAAPKADMAALWRRLVFNILISNTDDHLRNHSAREAVLSSSLIAVVRIRARHGLTKPEIDRMASAFEHQDLEMARRGGGGL